MHNLKEFYITFGSQYNKRQDIHFFGGHRDGYFTIEATDEEEARKAIFRLTGSMWSLMYDSLEGFNAKEYAKLGELVRFKASEILKDKGMALKIQDFKSIPIKVDLPNVRAISYLEYCFGDYHVCIEPLLHYSFRVALYNNSLDLLKPKRDFFANKYDAPLEILKGFMALDDALAYANKLYEQYKK